MHAVGDRLSDHGEGKSGDKEMRQYGYFITSFDWDTYEITSTC